MIYFIPGAGEARKDYKPFFSALRKHKIKFLNLHIDDVFDLPVLSREDIVIGFSIGAVIAYLIACKGTNFSLKHLILCSPSPIIVRGKKPHAIKITILIGRKEHPIMRVRGRVLAKKWGVSITLVDAGHDINRLPYIEKIDSLLSSD